MLIITYRNSYRIVCERPNFDNGKIYGRILNIGESRNNKRHYTILKSPKRSMRIRIYCNKREWERPTMAPWHIIIAVVLAISLAWKSTIESYIKRQVAQKSLWYFILTLPTRKWLDANGNIVYIYKHLAMKAQGAVRRFVPYLQNCALLPEWPFCERSIEQRACRFGS